VSREEVAGSLQRAVPTCHSTYVKLGEVLTHSFVFISVFSCGASTRFRVIACPYGASWSHSDTPHSVGFLRTNDRPNLENTTWHQHTTLRFRTRNSSKRAAGDPRLLEVVYLG